MNKKQTKRTGKQKEKALVTLADKNYIDQAKQVFSGVYHNAGWDGDYVLLAYDIPEKKLKWFREKGIIVKKIGRMKTLHPSENSFERSWDGVILSKFYLFTEYFKKWKKVVFLDGDIIVNGPLDRILDVKKFGAVINNPLKLRRQFLRNKEGNEKTFRELASIYSLDKDAFNSGVMAFDTSVIREDTFEKLNLLYKKYGRIVLYPEQAILNLYFYRNWKKLPRTYNFFVGKPSDILPRKKKALVLHQNTKIKPWHDKKQELYNIWKKNLEKAEKINPKKVSDKKRSYKKIRTYMESRKLEFIFWFDRFLGKTGILIKKHSPVLYETIKEKINKKERLKNKNLLVTLANKDYIDQAKQVFSGVYHNAGWDGDYMLLCDSINKKDKKWFENKGIIVNEKPLIFNEKEWYSKEYEKNFPVIVSHKFYLFTNEFKKWDKIIFLDADVMIRGKIDFLKKTKKFSAVPDLYWLVSGKKFKKLKDQFFKETKNKETLNRLGKKFNLNKTSFNTGVMAFDTSVINEKTFEKLKELHRKYGNIVLYGEQGTINLYFYKKWKKIPLIYNVWPILIENNCPIGKILHFPEARGTKGRKPWNKENPFYREWVKNFELSEKIGKTKKGLNNGEKSSTRQKATLDILILKKTIDFYVGKIGLIIKKHSPLLYNRLKKNGK